MKRIEISYPLFAARHVGGEYQLVYRPTCEGRDGPVGGIKEACDDYRQP